MIACASRPDRDIALAVGTEGLTLRFERNHPSVERIEGAPDLSCAAVDVLGRLFAGGVGQLWMNPGGIDGRWTCIWRDPSWRAPFVGVFADATFAVAVTADAGVLEYRTASGAVSVVATRSR